MTCPACHSERTRTLHTDRRIEIRCKACGQVSLETYGQPQRKAKQSEAEQAAETVEG